MKRSPYEHKYAALRYLKNRLNVYQINPSARKDELIIIQNILYSNGFSLQLINNLLKKQKLPQPPTKKKNFNQKQKWATFTFFGNETHFITKIFRPFNGF
jgi:hypothetical protein